MNNQEMVKFNRLYQWLTNDLRPFLGEISQKFHLTYDQYMLLKEIQNNKHISGSELAANQHISRAAISRRCRELQVLGFIDGISRQEPDYRLTYFEVSDYGSEVLGELNRSYQQWIEKIGEEYDRAKFSQLIQLADELVDQARIGKRQFC